MNSKYIVLVTFHVFHVCSSEKYVRVAYRASGGTTVHYAHLETDKWKAQQFANIDAAHAAIDLLFKSIKCGRASSPIRHFQRSDYKILAVRIVKLTQETVYTRSFKEPKPAK